MLDLKSLTHTVQQNCHISDAQFAGNYTLCIFLLKMREYYRWEKGIPQSHSIPKEAIGQWLTERESFWDELESSPYLPITIAHQDFDPFETDAINLLLNPLGYVYSGGIGIFHKPYFFLGKLEKKEQHHHTTLLISSTEYARDLAAPPAMSLGNTIFIRRESLRRSIWEKIEEWQQHKHANAPMAKVLSLFNKTDMETILNQLTEDALSSVVLHEMGEARAGLLLGAEWENLLSSLPRSRAEMLARAVRDHLADSLTTLPTLLEQEASNTEENRFAALHFYFANFNGVRKSIFPEAYQAYQNWVKHDDLSELIHIIKKGHEHWLSAAKNILALYNDSINDNTRTLASAIENLYPLND